MLSILQGEDWLLCTDSYGAWATRLENAPPIDIVVPFFGRADDLAPMALAVLSHKTAGYVTGASIVIDGGMALTNWFEPPALEDI